MFTIKYIKTEGFKINLCSYSLFFFKFFQVNVKEYLWKCLHAKIGPFQYIKVFKELFTLLFWLDSHVCDKILTF